MLALGCVVALYFWAPLVWKWLPGTKASGGGPAAAMAVSSVTAPPAIASAQKQPTDKSVNKYGWDELVRWMGLDQRTKPAMLDTDFRSPFRLTPAQQQMLRQEPTADSADPHVAATNIESQPLDLSPRQLGLVLSGTIVGPRVRVATINGKTYRESAQIIVSMSGSAAEQVDGAESAASSQRIEFILAEVHPHKIVLVRAGKPYELALQRATLAGDEQLILSRTSLEDN